jgi:hypothetical protein
LTFGGEQVRVVVQVHDEELERRSSAQGDTWLTREMLELMFELPVDEVVDESTIAPGWLPLLPEVPEWALARDGGGLVRQFQPAATVQTVLAADSERPWSDQLETLRWFAPLARTMVLVVGPDEAFAAAEAASAAGVGIGIADDDGGWFEAVRPAVTGVQLTPHRWLLGECAAAQLMESAEELRSKPERTDRG